MVVIMEVLIRQVIRCLNQLGHITEELDLPMSMRMPISSLAMSRVAALDSYCTIDRWCGAGLGMLRVLFRISAGDSDRGNI